jgi:hypothetical protein
MRKTILGLVAAFAVVAAGVAPASACNGCSPCGYVSPCAQTYVQPYVGCCGAAYERLPDPAVQYHAAPIAPPQYYYVEQGPTYTGPGNFAPYRYYQEQGVTAWGYHHRYRHHGYHYRPHVLHSLY